MVFWKSHDYGKIGHAAYQSAVEILKKKSDLSFHNIHLKISFVAADGASGFFGPPKASRFSVVGKARGRAEALLELSPKDKDSVLTNAETLAHLTNEEAERFTLHSDDAYILE